MFIRIPHDYTFLHAHHPHSTDSHRALELLEDYRKRLSLPENQQLYDALTKAIVAIRSRLFQALLGKTVYVCHLLVYASKETFISYCT